MHRDQSGSRDHSPPARADSVTEPGIRAPRTSPNRDSRRANLGRIFGRRDRDVLSECSGVDTTLSIQTGDSGFVSTNGAPVCQVVFETGEGVVEASARVFLSPEEYFACDNDHRRLVPLNRPGFKSPCGLPSPQICGDNVVSGHEECDGGDFCSSICTLEPGCGNNRIDPGEECDDGNDIEADNCTSACSFPACGNGTLDFGDQCDDGNTDDGDGCSSLCQNEACGNGSLDSGEECDDGNLSAGDGCSAECVFEEATSCPCWNGSEDSLFGASSAAETWDLARSNLNLAACTETDICVDAGGLSTANCIAQTPEGVRRFFTTEVTAVPRSPACLVRYQALDAAGATPPGEQPFFVFQSLTPIQADVCLRGQRDFLGGDGSSPVRTEPCGLPSP
ncbi:MAG: DUF4215 domain-containing protein [Myxococcota bacterium]